MAKAGRPSAVRPARRIPAKTKEAGAKPAPASSSSDDAEARLEAFIDRFDPKVAAQGRKAIAHMRKRLPGALALVYDNYNALGVGFISPLAKVSKVPVSLVLYPRWVTLFFLYGATLPDPHGLMEGKGSRVRSVRLADASDLKDPRIDPLIAAAVMQSGWLLEPKAKGRTVIQAVAPTQRPRRP
jgi:hypothetical protein